MFCIQVTKTHNNGVRQTGAQLAKGAGFFIWGGIVHICIPEDIFVLKGKFSIRLMKNNTSPSFYEKKTYSWKNDLATLYEKLPCFYIKNHLASLCKATFIIKFKKNLVWQGNEIERLADESFQNLHNLQTLNLAYNNLRYNLKSPT